MSNSFFRTLWRFNALAIAVCGLLGIFVGMFAAYHVARDVFRTSYQAQDIARVEPAETAKPGDPATPNVQTGFSTGYFSVIRGTTNLQAPIIAKQSYDFRYSSKDASSTRNFLFYDTATGSSRKLLADEKQLIVAHSELRPDGETGATAPKALLFHIVEADTTKDGILSHADAITFALARTDGSGLTRLDLKGAGSHGQSVSADGATLILFVEEAAGVLKAHHVDLSTFKITRTDAIAR